MKLNFSKILEKIIDSIVSFTMIATAFICLLLLQFVDWLEGNKNSSSVYLTKKKH